MDLVTDSDTASLLQPEMDIAPLSLLHHNEILTRPVQYWCDGVLKHQEALSAWFVVKVDHMKNFHYSAVFHEYLRVTLRHHGSGNSQDGQEEHTIYVEREVEEDQITVGAKHREIPKLYSLWIVRFLRGNYSGLVEGGVRSTANSSYTPAWREQCYSASDFLRNLEFEVGKLSLLEFANVACWCSKERQGYHVTKANCYWFANEIFAQLKHDKKGQYKEFEGGYIKHMGMFLGLRILFNPDTRKLHTHIKDIDGSNLTAEEKLKQYTNEPVN
ncbi:hypothetical protein F4806DRAFT_449821 [Annulohypoxylon nitens]|nr:hypothetical protein F4806DRAFT_449821 [Annulohypoxylon nitens]